LIAGEEEEDVLMGVNWPVVAASTAGLAMDMTCGNGLLLVVVLQVKHLHCHI